MPHSLRVRLSGLRYKGIITDKDYQRLCEALDCKKVADGQLAMGFRDGYKQAAESRDKAIENIKIYVDLRATTRKDGDWFISREEVFDIIDQFYPEKIEPKKKEE